MAGGVGGEVTVGGSGRARTHSGRNVIAGDLLSVSRLWIVKVIIGECDYKKRGAHLLPKACNPPCQPLDLRRHLCLPLAADPRRPPAPTPPVQGRQRGLSKVGPVSSCPLASWESAPLP